MQKNKLSIKSHSQNPKLNNKNNQEIKKQIIKIQKEIITKRKKSQPQKVSINQLKLQNENDLGNILTEQ